MINNNCSEKLGVQNRQKSARVEGKQDKTPFPAGRWRRNLQHLGFQDAGSLRASLTAQVQPDPPLTQPIQAKVAPALEIHSPARGSTGAELSSLGKSQGQGSGERREVAGLRGTVETPCHANSRLMCSGQSHASRRAFHFTHLEVSPQNRSFPRRQTLGCNTG